MVADRQKMGQALALEQLRSKREENKLALQQAKVEEYRAKLQEKDKKKQKNKLEKFSKAVESQNVKGTIPTVESRGVHNMVVFNPFKQPEKELERDSKTGLLHVKNSIWG